jgi:hypothetical protein
MSVQNRISEVSFEVWMFSKDSKEGLDKMIVRLQREVKNPNISQTERNIYKEDIEKCLKIQHTINELSTMQIFYGKEIDVKP